MKRIIAFALTLMLLSNCGKEKLPWQVMERGFKKDLRLEEVHSEDFSETNPYDTIPDSQYMVFTEKHEYNEAPYGQNVYKKEFIIEIHKDTEDFYYEGEEIYQNLKCALWHDYYSSHDGYYRIKKGWIKGTRVGATWDIDFHITYGGRKDNRYEMKANAAYD